MNNAMIAVVVLVVVLLVLAGCAPQPDGWISTTVEVG